MHRDPPESPEHLEAKVQVAAGWPALGLPLPYRTAVRLHDVVGLSGSEVAAVTGVPLGTAKARIRRGRAVLACQLVALDPALNAEVR